MVFTFWRRAIEHSGLSILPPSTLPIPFHFIPFHPIPSLLCPGLLQQYMHGIRYSNMPTTNLSCFFISCRDASSASLRMCDPDRLRNISIRGGKKGKKNLTRTTFTHQDFRGSTMYLRCPLSRSHQLHYTTVHYTTVKYSTVFDEFKKIQNQQQFSALQCRLSMCVCVCVCACVCFVSHLRLRQR